ncbi:hypothetical protein Lal_00024893 [Lupinus albus]|uniref:Putative tetratricopeptide-like helical domain, thioredoxin-like protein n=1 Tax=Lupinus albus TaxID=3870 RepID=A0A6A4PX49_LUPAL|nr:putative tetratricopeptide-like helical domain, thioredoxin-like protein [Lupinus albus]KAF1889566.1 hypothetical protein Lal_00024893 [Lupinus albus]
MAGKVKNHNKVGNELCCGFMGRVLQLKSYKLRTSSVHSLPVKPSNNAPQRDHIKNEPKMSPNDESKVLQISYTYTPALTEKHKLSKDQKPAKKVTFIDQNEKHSDAAINLSTTSSTIRNDHQKKPQKEFSENSLVLATISTGHQRDFGALKLTGNLLVNNTPRRKSVDFVPKNKELSYISNSYSNNAGQVMMGNIIRGNSDDLAKFRSTRNNIMDPEVLKSIGNEAYKQRKFEEALSLYDKAIAIDSNKATYHCNKSAALIALGSFQEAIVECQESIRLEPSYHRAYNRLATIYFRLGQAEKALDCSNSTPYPDSLLPFQAQALQNHLKECIEARKVNRWSVILKETQSAISLGADSSPQVYALQTEALLKLLRYQEAHAAYEKMPKYSVDWCNNIFGLACSAYLLVIGAQVHLASGRFEDAVAAAQQAAKVDPSNVEVNVVLRRARTVTSARMSGNLLFKASKFMEACSAYNEGLEHDPHNSVLLCNRAACRSKLGQYEKAVEDCNVALIVQPNYSKARLRRADCNAKLERWEAAIKDYEMLIREKPGDEEVARALFEAQLQLKMLRGEDIKDLKFGSNLVFISTANRFRHYVTLPGMAVVLFSNKETNKQVLLMLEKTSKRFPSVNFLKVEIEDHPFLAKSEGVSSIPAFKIYKNGSRVEEISGKNHDLLERSVELYSS